MQKNNLLLFSAVLIFAELCAPVLINLIKIYIRYFNKENTI